MSPEEHAQAMSGPHAFALEWLKAAMHDDIDGVWPNMTFEFRLSSAQDWIWHNPAALQDPLSAGLSREGLAEVLASAEPRHGLFQHLARVTLRALKNSYGELNFDHLRAGARPRPIGVDLEVVRLLNVQDLSRDEEGNYVFAPGASARSATVIVQHTATGWAVAGVGEHLRRPGWPPEWERVAGPED